MRGVTLLVSRNSETVDSVRVVKEISGLRVLLDVSPATSLPSARHEVQVRVHVLLEVHQVDRLSINSPDLLFFLTAGHDLVTISAHFIESTRTQ